MADDRDILARLDAVADTLAAIVADRPDLRFRLLDKLGGGPARKRGRGPSKAEAELLVSDYLAAQREAGRDPTSITRDGVANAIGIGSGTVSGTDAWQRFAIEKDQAGAHDPTVNRRGTTGSTTDALIDALDRGISTGDEAWEEILAEQLREEAAEERRAKRAKRAS